MICQLCVLGCNGVVLLENIVDIFIGSGFVQIDCYDCSCNVIISVGLEGCVLGDINMVVEVLLFIKNLLLGVCCIVLGDVEGMQELFSSFFFVMFVGVLCVYVVLVLFFYDFMQLVMILVVLLLLVGGVFGLLVLFGFSLLLLVLIGLLMLMGIVIKNLILLVEYVIVVWCDFGMLCIEVIIDVCYKCVCFIVMMMVVMMVGMVLMVFGLEGDVGFCVLMVVVVIGGLLIFMLLSLLVVFVVFEKVDDFREWVLCKFCGVCYYGCSVEFVLQQEQW